MAKCVLCNNPIIGFGNNPWPLKETGDCCDVCNATKVIPARLAMVFADKRNEKKQ